MRAVYVLACVVAAAGGAAIPVVAYGGSAAVSSSSVAAHIRAVDFNFIDVANPSTSAVTIGPGASVMFDYPTGHSNHNVDFSGPQPASCQLDGDPPAAVPPLPHTFSPPGWSGSCTFATAGRYVFHCDLHGDMAGEVDVVDGGPTTTTTDTTTTTTGTDTTTTTTTTDTGPTTDTTTTTTTDTAPTTDTTTTTTTGTAPTTDTTTTTGIGPTTTTTTASPATATSTATDPSTSTAPVPPTTTTTVSGSGAPPKPAHAASRLVIAPVQRGTAIRGSIVIAHARSHLKLTLLAGHSTAATSSKPVNAGPHTFAVSLGASARRTLRRRHRLALTVKVTVTPASGPAYAATRAVVLKPS